MQANIETDGGNDAGAVVPAGSTRCLVVEEPVDLQALVAAVSHDECGAVATFLGTVRSPNAGQSVQYIDYEGYPAMIVAEMQRIGDELHAVNSGLRVILTHRLGRLRPGEASIAVVVASPHRAAALDACRDGIEACKRRLPVWKYEVGESSEGFVRGRSDASPTL
jgi:molybdopterin synthase catalytic subunit